jgi:beta-lactamase regulating signal transducer with metallopeptidase domain
MTELFFQALNASFMAGWLILAVLLMRALLKKAPKWISCALWALVALRLLLPFSIESPLSLLPSAKPISIASENELELPSPQNASNSMSESDIIAMPKNQDSNGFNGSIAFDPAIGTSLPNADEPSAAIPNSDLAPQAETKTASLDTQLQLTLFDSGAFGLGKIDFAISEKWIQLFSALWLLGFGILLLQAFLRFLLLKRTVSVSLEREVHELFAASNGRSLPVRECDEIKSPFLLGILKPIIYIPSRLETSTLRYVLLHEQAHLKRLDHLWKPFGYLLLSIYWFHPLCWVAYALFCRDMESACDEKVVRSLDHDGKAAYSEALLGFSLPKSAITACPLAFGENNTKQRVKDILSYKKPTFWVILAALACVIVLGFCFLTNPKKPLDGETDNTLASSQESPDQTKDSSGENSRDIATEASGTSDGTEVASSEKDPSSQEVVEGWDPDSDRIPTQEELIQYWYDHRDYPLKAGSAAWLRYFSMGLLYKMQGPPEDLLKEMSSDELAELLFRYPGGILTEFAGDTAYMQIEVFKRKCNIFEELTNRTDGPHAILNAFSKIELDFDAIKGPNCYQDIGYNAEQFVYYYVTYYQDQFSAEDIAYYEEVYQERYEKYYSKYEKDTYSRYPTFRKVVFSQGNENRGREVYTYSLERLKALKNLWYQKRFYPDYLADAPSGYDGYSLNGQDVTEDAYIDVINPPADLLSEFSTQELADMVIKYYTYVWPYFLFQYDHNVLSDGFVDAYFTYQEKNSDILKELLNRTDGIHCVIAAYEAFKITSKPYNSLGIDLFRNFDDMSIEYLACRFMDRYLDRFTEEDIQYYYAVYDQKKAFYDQIQIAAVRELFETELSRQRQ